MQVLFGYQSLTPPALDLPGLTARSWALFTGTAKLDLTMYVDSSEGNGASLALEYNTDLFDAPWAERFLRCYARLLEQAATAPHTPVSELSLLSPEESRALVALTTGPMSGLVRIRHRTRPDAAAGRHLAGDRRHRCRCRWPSCATGPPGWPGCWPGAGSGWRPRSGCAWTGAPECSAALLAVWWAGGAYVPLDPDFPPVPAGGDGRWRRGADHPVRQGECRSGGAAASRVPRCSTSPTRRWPGPSRCRRSPVPPDALAYLIFTSGSTGQPKGIGIEHRSVANLLASFGRLARPRPGRQVRRGHHAVLRHRAAGAAAAAGVRGGPGDRERASRPGSRTGCGR